MADLTQALRGNNINDIAPLRAVDMLISVKIRDMLDGLKIDPTSIEDEIVGYATKNYQVESTILRPPEKALRGQKECASP